MNSETYILIYIVTLCFMIPLGLSLLAIHVFLHLTKKQNDSLPPSYDLIVNMDSSPPNYHDCV